MSCKLLDTGALDGFKIVEKDFTETNLYSAEISFENPVEFWLGTRGRIQTLVVTWKQKDVFGVTEITEITQNESVIEIYQQLIFLTT